MLAEDFGALVLSADEFARQALEPGSPALAQVRQAFGESFFNGEELNRKALGAHVFANPEERKKLERIVHPEVRDRAAKAFQERAVFKQTGDTAPLVVYDCPLFFEADLGKENFRAVILVTAPHTTRLARIAARDGLTEAAAELRLQNQWSDEKKAPLADIVIKNDTTLEELKRNVAAAVQALPRNA